MTPDTRQPPKYKIAYLIDALSMGGAERLMVPILQHLDRAQFEPYVCALQSKDGNPMADEIRRLGIPVDCLEIRHLRDLRALPRLRGYLQTIGADLVHTQLEFANILGNVSAKLLGLPSSCTLHAMPSLDVEPKRKFHQRLEWLVLRRLCDRVISVSEEARQHHLRISGATPAQVKTLYNGIDLAPFVSAGGARAHQDVRAEFGLPPDARLLTTVAVLRPQKGIQFMIQALPAVLAAHPDVHYLVAGSGAHHGALLEASAKAGVQDRVIFAGMRNDVPRLLAASDVFVLPTLTEALPTVLAEAMAARVPIIASRVGGVPEMVTDGQNGCLVTPADVDALVRACTVLLTEPETRTALAARGWEIVNERFNIERQVDQLESLYRRELQAYGK